MVLDTSVVLAIFFEEKFGPWGLDQMQRHPGELRMSTVNYAETLILIHERQPTLFQAIQRMIDESSVRLVPPTRTQAEAAALARFRFPLNLGDCFAYALAKEHGVPLLTLDRDFRNTDVEVILPHVH